jgi:hypothetical protein
LSIEFGKDESTIRLKKADLEREHIPFTGTKEELLLMRAFLMCAQIELMMNWQDYNRGREEKLPWN